MKIRYDAEVDALTIIFRVAECETTEVGDGIALDYDSDGHLAGIEILDASKRFGDDSTFRQISFENLAPPSEPAKS